MSLGIDRVDGFFKSCCGSFYLLPARSRCPLRGVEGRERGGRDPESHLIESLTNAVPLGHISGFDFYVVVVGCEKQLVKM